MQTEVLQTDKLETRLEYLENELGKIKEMREQFDMPDCNMIYNKQLQIDVDGEVNVIGASIMRDQSFQFDQSLHQQSQIGGQNHRRSASTGPKVKIVTSTHQPASKVDPKSAYSQHVGQLRGVTFLDVI